MNVFLPAAGRGRLLLSASCLALAGAAGPAFAQAAPGPVALDEIVVSATGTPTPAREIASSVTVVTAEEIERQQRRTLPQALAALPPPTIAIGVGYAMAEIATIRPHGFDIPMRYIVTEDGIRSCRGERGARHCETIARGPFDAAPIAP